ncbi:hypothetical protein B0H19DRAFT_1141815 [Mycena capillaripes]|nr:hypothetical protein B0H19DRAFT_1141815 [Mycena capillaripes]
MTDAQPLTMSAQLAAINREIAWHYTQISILKARANALNPISTLPNEIISKIFGVYAFLSGPPFDLKWSQVMYVCRRWHDIALGEQYLWGFIQVSVSRNITKRMRGQLERSGSAPLTVHIQSLHSEVYAVLILQHAERLLELHLSGEAKYVLGFMNSLPGHSFPLLRSVMLHPSYKWEDVPEGVSTTLPDALFDGRAPCLTELNLSRVPLNWSLLRQIHSLSLNRALHLELTQTDPSAQADSFAKILSVLKASPTLTYLKLGRVISSQNPLQSYPAVTLPLLDFLWIQDDVEFCDLLLRHVIIPPTARLSVYGLGIRSGADIADFLIPLRKHVRAPTAPSLRCLQVDASGTQGTRTHFMLSTFTPAAAPDRLEYDKSTFLLNTHPTTEHFLREIMTKVLNVLPCATITHLDCRSATHITVRSWKTAIAHLPSLEMIYTWANSAATNVFTALAELSEGLQGAYPPLRHIHLYASVWKTRDDDEDIVAPMLHALRQLLRARHERGTPLEVLEIEEQMSSLNMEETEWEALFELVERFLRDAEVYDPPATREWIRQLRLAHPSDSDSV